MRQMDPLFDAIEREDYTRAMKRKVNEFVLHKMTPREREVWFDYARCIINGDHVVNTRSIASWHGVSEDGVKVIINGVNKKIRDYKHWEMDVNEVLDLMLKEQEKIFGINDIGKGNLRYRRGHE